MRIFWIFCWHSWRYTSYPVDGRIRTVRECAHCPKVEIYPDERDMTPRRLTTEEQTKLRWKAWSTN